MKTKNLLILSSLFLLVFCFNTPPGDELEKEQILKKVRLALSYLHFSPKEIDTQFSQNVFDLYMESLDPYKRNFIKKDFQDLAQYRDDLDKYYEDEDLTFYNLSSDLYYKSVAENEKLVGEILKENLDFEKEDYLILDEYKKDYPSNLEEKKNEWRRYIKYLILDEVQTVKEDSANDGKSKAELLSLAKEKVSENMEDYYRRVNSRNKDELFNYYVNAFAEDYDPHTYYFSPKDKKYFDQSISGSFEGIGATLSDEKGYATIKSLVIGGPAWKSKLVFQEDKILEVQEVGGEPVNIVGMPLDDAIMLIRGKKGSKVTLTLKREDGSIEKVVIERDKIELEESYVKSTVLQNGNDPDKVGYILIPSFYIDVNNRAGGRNVSTDVKKEIENLKEAGVKSIILDVRNNGGGSLSEVVDIVGFFIKDGPVVQVKNSDNTEKVLYDKDESIIWTGPLAVMTNEFSASASEILAGAIQDYKRGIIIGSEHTYGKGTVQQVIPLERFTEESSLGDLKLTIQKFYRITGASTQLKGVQSDIIIPDRYKYAEVSEKNQEHALPWDEVNSLKYEVWKPGYNISELEKHSQARLSKEPYVQKINEEAEYIKGVRNQEKIPLNYEAFMQELENKEQKVKYFDDNPSLNDLEIKPVDSYEGFETYSSRDTIAKAKIEDWHKNIKKDFYIKETLNVLDEAM